MRGLIIVAERWRDYLQTSELAQNIFAVKILVKLDVKLNPRMFIF